MVLLRTVQLKVIWGTNAFFFWYRCENPLFGLFLRDLHRSNDVFRINSMCLWMLIRAEMAQIMSMNFLCIYIFDSSDIGYIRLNSITLQPCAFTIKINIYVFKIYNLCLNFPLASPYSCSPFRKSLELQRNHLVKLFIYKYL